MIFFQEDVVELKSIATLLIVKSNIKVFQKDAVAQGTKELQGKRY